MLCNLHLGCRLVSELIIEQMILVANERKSIADWQQPRTLQPVGLRRRTVVKWFLVFGDRILCFWGRQEVYSAARNSFLRPNSRKRGRYVLPVQLGNKVQNTIIIPRWRSA